MVSRLRAPPSPTPNRPSHPTRPRSCSTPIPRDPLIRRRRPRQQHHQATLIQTVTPDAPAVVSSLGALTVRLLEQGIAAGTSATMALGQLNDRTKDVASVRAYDDCFLIYAIIGLLTLVPVLMVPRRRVHH